MSERTVLTRLRIEYAQAKAALRDVRREFAMTGDATKRTQMESSTALGKMGESASKHAAEWTQAGMVVTAVGAAMALALAGSAKAAIDWESDWASVQKTVEGADFAGIEGQLRGLARSMPTNHQELADVASAAGALGVETPNVVQFTKTMVMLGEATDDLPADQAATNIAQLMNVMRTAPEDVERLASTLVHLGNNGASTEGQILDMAQRLAGAGKLIGASEADVLALANAMASMGIESQLGGGAMSRVILEIYSAVKSGGPALERFADVAEMSSGDFVTAFGENPVAVIDRFVQGLGRIDAQGGNVKQTINDLGIAGTQNEQVLLRMAGAGDLTAKSIEMAAQAWRDNTALTEEYNKRAETTASQLKVLRNNVTDAGISLGNVFLPAINGAAGAAADFFGWISQLPEPLQEIAAITGSAAAATTLAAGAFLILAPRVMDTYQAYRLLAATNPKVASMLMTSGKAAGIAGAALVAMVAGTRALDQWLGDVPREGREVADTLQKIGETGQFTDEQLNALGGDKDGLDSLGEKLDRIFNPSVAERARDIGEEIVSLGGLAPNMGPLQKTQDFWTSYDNGLTALVEGGKTEAAAQAFAVIAAEARNQGIAVEDLADILPGYAQAMADAQGGAVTNGEALANLGNGAIDTGAAMLAVTGQSTTLTGAINAGGDSAKDYATALDDLSAALQQIYDDAFGLESAQDGLTTSYKDLAQQVREAKKAKDENATSLEGNSRAAIANRTAVRGLVDGIHAVTVEQAKAGASSRELTESVRQQKQRFKEQLIAMGFSKTEAQRYATDIDEATIATEAYALALGELDGKNIGIDVDVNMLTLDEAIAKAGTLEAALSNLTRSEKVAAALGAPIAIAANRVPSKGKKGKGKKNGRADGGYISGPGGPTDDLIPAWLSDGEYVVRAAAVDRIGVPALDRINTVGFAHGGHVGYASGGVVSSVQFDALLAAWREVWKVIGEEEKNRVYDDMSTARAGVPAAERDLRDANRGLRDTKESNAERTRTGRKNVRDAQDAIDEAREKQRKAKTKKGRAKAAAEEEEAEKELTRARRERKRGRRDNREDRENATFRVRQQEEALAQARLDAEEATRLAAEADEAYAAGKIPLFQQLGEALGTENADLAAFEANVRALASRGHTTLAATLLAQGDGEAAAIAAEAVALGDAEVKALEAQISTNTGLQDRLAALPTVFTILEHLAKKPGDGVSMTAWATGIDMVTLQQAAATAKDLIANVGGHTFLAELARNGYAYGGVIGGVGGPRDDANWIRASRGEGVVQEPAMRALGAAGFHAVNNAHLMQSAGGGTRVIERVIETRLADTVTLIDRDGSILAHARVIAEDTSGAVLDALTQGGSRG